MASLDLKHALEEKLRCFFLDMSAVKSEADRNDQDADSFVFHIMECFDDFKDLSDIHEHPERFSDEEINLAVRDLLYHALPHLIAAAKKYDYVPDIL